MLLSRSVTLGPIHDRPAAGGDSGTLQRLTDSVPSTALKPVSAHINPTSGSNIAFLGMLLPPFNPPRYDVVNSFNTTDGLLLR